MPFPHRIVVFTAEWLRERQHKVGIDVLYVKVLLVYGYLPPVRRSPLCGCIFFCSPTPHPMPFKLPASEVEPNQSDQTLVACRPS